MRSAVVVQRWGGKAASTYYFNEEVANGNREGRYAKRGIDASPACAVMATKPVDRAAEFVRVDFAAR